MKFAVLDGERLEAAPGLIGSCQGCGQEMIAKCGKIKVWHWAHKVRHICDVWWENETEWHREWKNVFPNDWQEILHKDANGERHIADIRTKQGWVIEFQHSKIELIERQSRDQFYKKLAWVVDGKRRKRDETQFAKAINSSMPTRANSPVRMVMTDGCLLLREWADCPVPVFFDFGGTTLWWLIKGSPSGRCYVAPYGRKEFIDIHLHDVTNKRLDFESFVQDLDRLITDFEKLLFRKR